MLHLLRRAAPRVRRRSIGGFVLPIPCRALSSFTDNASLPYAPNGTRRRYAATILARSVIIPSGARVRREARAARAPFCAGAPAARRRPPAHKPVPLLTRSAEHTSD